MSEQVLYLLRHPTAPIFKIGISTDPQRRWSQISGGPLHAESCYFTCGRSARRVEQLLHELFVESNRHQQGDGGTEWFDLGCLAGVRDFLASHAAQLQLGDARPLPRLDDKDAEDDPYGLRRRRQRNTKSHSTALPRINVLCKVRIGSRWRLLPLAKMQNGARDFSHVKHGTALLSSAGGTFYFEWREGTKRRRQAIGVTATFVQQELTTFQSALYLHMRGMTIQGPPRHEVIPNQTATGVVAKPRRGVYFPRGTGVKIGNR